LARPGAMVSLSHVFLELIKHKVVYLISALSMVWDCHFNLLEPNCSLVIFVFITLRRNEKQAVHARFGLVSTRAHSDLAEFFASLTLYPF
jgi:hypothetical protein